MTVTKEMIGHIKDAELPSQAWNALAILFNQAIETKLSLLEKRLGSVVKMPYVMSIAAYFGRVKELCFQCEQLDGESKY